MNNEYNGGLTREQFLYPEMKITASLVCQGLSKDEIYQRIYNENLFQFPTERMLKSITGACLRRIEALDSPVLTELLSESSSLVGKQINLYAMMKYNRIVWDFMTTVIGEKYRNKELIFSRQDVNLFFIRLQEQNDSVASWSDSTIQKIKQVLVKSITECGYIDSVKSETLNPVMIAPELEDEIKNKNDFAALAAFNCFR